MDIYNNHAIQCVEKLNYLGLILSKYEQRRKKEKVDKKEKEVRYNGFCKGKETQIVWAYT